MKDHIIERPGKYPVYLSENKGGFKKWKWTPRIDDAKRFTKTEAMDIGVDAWGNEVSVNIHRLKIQRT